MSITDLIPKCISNQGGCNMTLYCNLKMNLTFFEYNNNTYVIDDYDMKEDCFILKCQQNTFKIPVNLTLHRDDNILKSNLEEYKKEDDNKKEDDVKLDIVDLDVNSEID